MDDKIYGKKVSEIVEMVVEEIGAGEFHKEFMESKECEELLAYVRGLEREDIKYEYVLNAGHNNFTRFARNKIRKVVTEACEENEECQEKVTDELLDEFTSAFNTEAQIKMRAYELALNFFED